MQKLLSRRFGLVRIVTNDLEGVFYLQSWKTIQGGQEDEE